ncbi:MAG: DUF4890 domain-containing protein, partial [Tannerella sp.]|nr:DUF4890 domain-containing protein [Tannerella sp.]
KFVLFIVFSLACTPLFAQAPQGSRGGGRSFSPEEMAQRTTEWMTKELNLTSDQTTPVDSINLLYARAQQILFQSSEGERDKIREAMDALNQEKEKALAKVLTEAQLELYKKRVSEMANRRRQR